MVKGILTAEDARRAVAEGVDAIVVSNHGGNVLDGSVATLRVLPEIVDAVGDEIEVLMDGGVRRGTDVVKAVALGARAVLLGRAYVYPLLAAGEPGVRRILELFHQQIDEALAFLGVESVHDLDPSLLDLPVRAGPSGSRRRAPRRFTMTQHDSIESSPQCQDPSRRLYRDLIRRSGVAISPAESWVLWHLGARGPISAPALAARLGRRPGRPGVTLFEALGRRGYVQPTPKVCRT